jgi:hypothetical protein
VKPTRRCVTAVTAVTEKRHMPPLNFARVTVLLSRARARLFAWAGEGTTGITVTAVTLVTPQRSAVRTRIQGAMGTNRGDDQGEGKG